MSASETIRARDLGIPFDGQPGQWNAITDVSGVTVGFHTLVGESESGAAIRTGVTAVLPLGRDTVSEKVHAAVFSLNGNGELTGSHWIEEGGTMEGPVMITNTHSVGVVRDAVIAWQVKNGVPQGHEHWWSMPVVGETYDGWLNDINGFHVRPEHVFEALETATSGRVAEGNVGGGTGMIAHQFKGGTGTSSRVVEIDGQAYTVGVLVQANYGSRDELRIAGVPVGRHLTENRAYEQASEEGGSDDSGSIIIVAATDAPLMPHQLKRLIRRGAMGLARMGSYAGNGSGDIFLAFSTANAVASEAETRTVTVLGNEQLNPLFLATVRATEEAIVNAMVAARTMTGLDGHRAVAIDHQALQGVLRQYGRLEATP
ncbi:MAG: P1 family peptidase [Xanthomonadales bacterium]|nr:P1 family peptidase [Xanthomonadales bacterium]